MNRILFVGLCLIGLLVFAVAKTDADLKEQPKNEVAKQEHKTLYQ